MNRVPKHQAPALVVVREDAKLVSANLVFDEEVIVTDSHPEAFTCIALLMSAYFVFNIEYPKPYCKHLEIIEKIISGNVKEHIKSGTESQLLIDYYNVSKTLEAEKRKKKQNGGL